MFFGVGVSCRYLYSFIVYLYVDGSGLITSDWEERERERERELICLLLFTCNYVVSVWRGYLFLWVLGMGYVILLWHSLSLPYNYFLNFMIIYAHLCLNHTHFHHFLAVSRQLLPVIISLPP